MTYTVLATNGPQSLSATTFTYTGDDEQVVGPTALRTITTRAGVPPPQCQLPTSVIPECQSQWDSVASDRVVTMPSSISIPVCVDKESTWPWDCYETDASYLEASASYEAAPSSLFTRNLLPAPSCTQASMGTAMCSSLRTAFFSFYAGDDVAGEGGTIWQNPGLNDGSTYPSFPPLSRDSVTTTYAPNPYLLAPGCSVGCGGCAVTGDSVRLLYWPVSSTLILNATLEDAISSVSMKSLSAYAFGTSFVSPTVYISYASVYASDSCSAIGTTHGATIIPLPDPNQLSSLWGSYPQGLSTFYTASFNFTDLQTPIPQSVYDS